MRKLCRWSALAVAGTSILLLIGAGYASRQPYSFIGRCTGLAYTIGVECNPLYCLGRAWAADDLPAMGTEDTASSDGDLFSIPDEPVPVGQSCPQDQSPQNPQILETIELVPVPMRPAYSLHEGGNSASEGAVVNERLSVIGLPVFGENDDRGYQWMPMCVDKLADTPDVMPYADQPASDSSTCLEKQAAQSTVDVNSFGIQQVGLEKLEVGKESDKGNSVSKLKSVRDRIRQFLESQGIHDSVPAGQAVDTLEFRPSDAGKDRRERIPF